mmetsp:Transcript_2047/g.8619  ORF Transcript_2047/g.8619 Transcript_2047/m.8619 type:complete len:355 (-) Transcript_2047:163-1227(-)
MWRGGRWVTTTCSRWTPWTATLRSCNRLKQKLETSRQSSRSHCVVHIRAGDVAPTPAALLGPSLRVPPAHAHQLLQSFVVLGQQRPLPELHVIEIAVAAARRVWRDEQPARVPVPPVLPERRPLGEKVSPIRPGPFLGLRPRVYERERSHRHGSRRSRRRRRESGPSPVDPVPAPVHPRRPPAVDRYVTRGQQRPDEVVPAVERGHHLVVERDGPSIEPDPVLGPAVVDGVVQRDEERGGDGHVELTAGAARVGVVGEVIAERSLQHRPDASDDAVIAAVSEDPEEDAVAVVRCDAARVHGGDERPGGRAGDGGVRRHESALAEDLPRAHVVRKDHAGGGEPDAVDRDGVFVGR